MWLVHKKKCKTKNKNEQTKTAIRVEDVPRVLRLHPGNSLSLHVHWLRADQAPMFASQVSQELRVTFSRNIAIVKPGSLTRWGKQTTVLY